MSPTKTLARPTRDMVRDRIVRAAASLIAEGGPGAASARAICKKARITAPTLYRLFGDLDGLYSELLKLVYVPEAQAHPGREFSDPEGMIEYMWDCAVGTAIRSPGLVDLKNQLLSAGTLPESMKQFYARLEVSFEELDRRHMLKLPPKIAAAMYWAAAVGIARMIASARHGAPECSAVAAEALREAVLAATIRDEAAMLARANPPRATKSVA
jgi:AcrR family transcriptional regulator